MTGNEVGFEPNRMIHRSLHAGIGIFLISLLCARGDEKVDFNRDVRPILSGKCFACHGPDEAERGGDVRLDTEAGSRHDMGGYAAVVPGDPGASELIYRVTTDDDVDIMPPEDKGKPLTEAEVAILTKWIEQGGEYAQHWAYEKPARPEIPATNRDEWLRNNEIDFFIQRRLESEGLEPSPQADRLTLARRAALDLTGLPPTWDEAQSFANDPDPEAFEKYIDAQLAKPAYGERWAAMWLDLARYADSAGYADDPPRSIWKYRDWVIEAFNKNVPYDQFTIEQIAGDLLENPKPDQLVATAFHRNTLTNSEGGTNDEEFRNAAVVDRVNTTMEVWMGTTMACAQCHTHKYDPLTHAEYFQLFDFFNQSADTDKKDENPLYPVWSDDLLSQKNDLEKKVKTLKETLSTYTPELEKAKQSWLANLKKPPGWKPLTVTSVASDEVSISEAEGWVSGEKEGVPNAVYSVALKAPAEKMTALAIEISPQQKRNFVLSRVRATWTPDKVVPVKGRYLRIENPGKKKFVHLAEVEVFSGGKNVALEAKATQSSTYSGKTAALAVDGNTGGDYAKGSVSHTNADENPWLEIDLGTEVSVEEVRVWNRTDGKGIIDRLNGYGIRLLDGERKEVWSEQPEKAPAPRADFAINGTRQIEFGAAIADHEQAGFPAGSILAKTLDPKRGWAIAPQVGKPHQLTLILKKPLEPGEGTLTVFLDQNSEHKNHLLTHFRLLATGDANVSEWSTMPEPVRKAVQSDPDGKVISDYFLTIAPALKPVRSQIAAAEKSLASLKPVTVPVMKDLPVEEERESFIQIRGNYKSLGEKVKRDVPAVFHPLREDLPRNRLALAHWLIDDANPLTARVHANRLWQQIFGSGIVPTSEEFGSQGELPSHPELLDWLAVELQESGWDQKAFLKKLVMSATYQQASMTTPELLSKDPFNRFYARAPRFRVSAEMVRDQALFVSGLLSDKMYGKPVNPPQPNLGLKAAFGSATDWKTSEGEDKFRRGLYTTWRRSSPYPSMATFDAPNREICSSRRVRTNTPLQALVTLNDPVYVEAAQALARKITSSGGETPAAKVRYAWQEVLIREPNDEEVARITTLFETLRTDFELDEGKAREMATIPIGPEPKGTPVSDLAAWTVVGNVLLNLDELFLKR